MGIYILTFLVIYMLQREIPDCSNSKNLSSLEGVTGIMPKVEVLGYDDIPSRNMYSTHMGV